ncbi:MAG: hypothetical protein VX834_08860, partial [Myxococcota bacterium]|nr:hypothetical protein [Myxococcota bacterium]
LYQFGGTYYPQRSPLGSPKVSAEMMKTVNQVAQMSRTLWNDKGEPVPLALEITPNLFEITQAAGKTLTLVYLSSGPTSLFNFNQKPSPHVVKVDWTKPSTAQVGVQLTDPQTGAHDYPQPMIVSESHWSLYRLLTQGKRQGLEWSWSFTSGKPGESLVVPVTFKLQQDPWALFSIDSASTVSQL